MAAPGAAASPQINLPTKIDDAGSPIHITQCLAGRNNDIGNGAYNVNFINTAPKTATVIEFVFRMRDGFDKILAYQPAMRQGTFAPSVQQGRQYYASGAGAGGAWDADLIWPGSAEVDCMIGRVRFADGSDWENPDWLKEEHSTDLIIPVLDQP
jgi:hypothetical protein